MALLETDKLSTALQVLISPENAQSLPDAQAVSINVVIPQSRQKIQKQIIALEYALLHDKSEKDRQIHRQALEALKKTLEWRLKMAIIDTDKLSPALQVLIGLEVEYNEIKHELSQLRKELDDLKERIQNGNDFSKYPLTLTVNDIAEILRIGKVQAYQLTHQESFPKIRDGRRIIVPKAAFIKWLNSEAFSGVQYIKERGINGKE